MAKPILVVVALNMPCLSSGNLRASPEDNGIPHVVSPAEQCQFPNSPDTPYYWENNCHIGKLGCLADGIHPQCRFCGEAGPFVGISCAANAIAPPVRACVFDNAPVTPVYWEPACTMGMKGCHADTKHVGCRFCGEGAFSDIPCPAKVCSFVNEPITPYYWDDKCQMGMLGCNADGIHVQCRFCAQRPFQSVTCPASSRPPYGECWFPHATQQRHYWDPNCTWGEVGCWADGVHAECRYCGGSGAYANITCP